MRSCLLTLTTLVLSSGLTLGQNNSAASVAVPVAQAGLSQAVIVIPRAPEESTRWAANELQRYLLGLSGASVPVLHEGEVAANAQDKSWILIGGPDQNPLVKQALDTDAHGIDSLKNDGFVLKTLLFGKRPVVVAAGGSDTGTMYAVFALVEQFGVTFRLSGDIIPERTSVLSVPPINISREPTIQQRGFLVEAHRASIAILSYDDWTKILDQMAKMKYNYLEYWWFPHQPFDQYSYRNESKRVDDMSTKESGYINSMYEGFGSRTTDDVVIGKQWFPGKRLAAPEFQNVETPEQAFATAQDLLRRVIHYANGKHIKVWLVDEMASLPPNLARYTDRIGPLPFESVFGTFVDPLDPVNREIQVNRLKALKETYPEAAGYLLDIPEVYYSLSSNKDLAFFAQPEQQALFQQLRGLMMPWDTRWVKTREEMVNSTLGYFDLVKYLLTKRDEVAPNTKLGVMTVGRGYVMPLFDQLLSKGIPFATFDTGGPCGYGTGLGMPMKYFGGMGDRMRIDSPYLDDDCDIVAQQFNVWVYTERDHIFTDGVKNGLTGVAPWMAQPRGTETNSSFLAEADWNPGLTATEFYRNYSQRLFGADAATDMEEAFAILEKNKAYLALGQVLDYPNTMPCCSPLAVVRQAHTYSLQANPFDGPKGPDWESFISNAPTEIAMFDHSISLQQEALARMHAAEPKVAPQGKHELAYLTSRTESNVDAMRAQILERKGFLMFDAAFRERNEVPYAKFVSDLEASLQPFVSADQAARAATTEYARIIDFPSDLEALYHLNVSTMLGFDLVHQWMQTIVNFHEGKPYAQHVPFERLYTGSVHNNEAQAD